MPALDPLHAALLGAVEGLTEFLPVSSTGHLILTSQLLGLQGEAVKTFEVVIQAGALGAVAGLYRGRIGSMARGVAGREANGRRLAGCLLVSFLPAAVAGLLLHRVIKSQLFSVWPVVAALAAGGVVMLADAWWRRATGQEGRKPLEALTVPHALLIGLAQCLALWPGTSRAMVTILAGLWLGLSASAAAEYSFLLALPTLGAATVFDLLQGGGALWQDVGPSAVLCGFAAAAAVAALAINGFIRYLQHRGLAVFGWYRLGLAGVMWWMLSR